MPKRPYIKADCSEAHKRAFSARVKALGLTNNDVILELTQRWMEGEAGAGPTDTPISQRPPFSDENLAALRLIRKDLDDLVEKVEHERLTERANIDPESMGEDAPREAASGKPGVGRKKAR